MKHCPKYIQELYGPVSPETWQEWLAFVAKARAVLSSPECDWEKARDFYNEAGQVSFQFKKCGMHSSSSLTTKNPFPWCGVSMYVGFVSRSVDLSIETSDSDLRTLAEFRDD